MLSVPGNESVIAVCLPAQAYHHFSLSLNTCSNFSTLG